LDGNQPQGTGGRASIATLVAILAPLPAVGIALVAHRLLPSLQSPLPTRLYPTLLIAIAAVWSLVAATSWGWGRLRPWSVHQGPLLAGGVGLLALWDLITLKFNLAPLPYFPGPDRVFQGMWEDRTLLLQSAYHSLLLQMTGFLTGAAAGVISGVLIGWSRKLRYWGMPVLKLVGPIPATAYVPLVMVLFSDAFVSGSALIALTVWFPVTMLTTSGIVNVPVALLDVARTLGANRWYLIFRVAIPSAMPNIFLGLFMGLGASFLTLVVAETVGVKAGLGWYVKWQQGYVEYAKVYGALILMAVFFSGLMTLLFKVRDRVLGWQQGLIRW
jgi:NitT/TauT family transport system permease protein